MKHIQGSGVIKDMIMDVCPVGMGGDDKCVFAFQKTLCKLICHTIVSWGDFGQD